MAVPEGPSLYILKEQTARFVGQTIVRAEGNTWAIDTARLLNQPVLALRTRGKQFFIQMPTMAVRIHMLLFGTYRINEGRDKPPRLSLHFADGSFLNFYACSVKEVDCEWNKEFTLKKHWLAHAQKICPRCHIPFHKANLGRSDRRSFWCERCQKLHS